MPGNSDELEGIALLLDGGADTETRDDYGRTPLLNN